jgi:hypothetical protein
MKSQSELEPHFTGAGIETLEVCECGVSGRSPCIEKKQRGQNTETW